MKRTFGLWLLLISCLLASCGSGTRNEAVSTSTHDPSPALSATTLSTLDGATVQGRVLVVQRGTIWLWHGAQGQPLVSGNASQPAWSPDGARIAYVSRSESASDIVVADGDGVQRTTLTANASQSQDHFERARASTWAWYPAWSDSTTILFAGQFGPPAGDPAAEFNMSLYRTSAAHAGEREQVLADSEAHCGRIATAPNGSVVYVRAASAQDGTQQIYRYAAGATAGTPFPGAPPESYDPAFSSDGAWLAFAARTAEGTDIWLLPGNGAATATPLRLTTNSRARAPAFSPDGKQFAFLAVPPTGKGFELWVVDLTYDASGQPSAGTPRQITQDMALDADSGISWAK